MGEVVGKGKIPTNGLVFYINGADRNCFVSGSFSGRQLAGSRETLNFQNQIKFYNEFGGYWELTSPGRGANGSGSFVFNSPVAFPSQFTHIIVLRRNDIAYEGQSWVQPTGTGVLTFVQGRESFITMINSNTFFNSTSTITTTDWFFGCGKNEFVGSAWTQSLFVRGFNNGNRVYETKTQNQNWSTYSGSCTGFTIGKDNLDNAPLGLYMSYNRPLSLEEINIIYDSIKYRYRMPRE